MLFATVNNKGLGNFKVKLNHSILKGMDVSQWKVFSSINAMQNYATGYAELSGKVTVLQKYLLLKNSYSEKVAVLKKYLLRKSACFE